MRSVRPCVRDVRITHLAISLQSPRTCLRSNFSCDTSLHSTILNQTSRSSSILATSIETPDDGLIALDDSSRPLRPPRPPRRGPTKLYSLGGQIFGKWQALSENPKSLAAETNFFQRRAPRSWRSPLLVDQPRNHGDFELWNCLLQYLKRTKGDEGVLTLWLALWGRKSLYQMNSDFEKSFWQTILEAALRLNDQRALDNLLIYAEWMKEIHGTTWSNLYSTIVCHFLRSYQHDKVLQWHLRLAPNFYPGSDEFSRIIRDFSTDPVLTASFTLQSLYIASPERRLYDILVPYLYGRGESQMARLWRNVCVDHDDGPLRRVPSKPFLRFLQGYWQTSKLHPKEILAVEDPDTVSVGEAENQVEVSREFMNRVHGKTFGLTAATYNDRLGARWFASSWVSVDLAISVISALGIRNIGPLSLQSICLRDPTPDQILARISQLRQAGIAIPDTSYTDTIQHFARCREDDLLMDMLQCDVHPDVFDDVQLQDQLIESSSAAGDWRTYTLLLASRMASVGKLARTAANTMLQMFLLHHNNRGVMRVLDDMRAGDITLDADHSRLMFAIVLQRLSWHPESHNPPRDLHFCLALCRRLSKMDVPVPLICWKKLFYCLGRSDKIDELFSLTLELLNYYGRRQSDRPGFMPVHLDDIPGILRKSYQSVDNLIGLYIPLDTPKNLDMHPLRQLFNAKAQADLIRWSFRKVHQPSKHMPLIGHNQQQAAAPPFCRALELLRKLHDDGVRVDILKVQKALVLRLAELYGNAPATKRNQMAARRTHLLSLGQMKILCDDAWGDEILPPLDVLRERISKQDEERWLTHERMEVGIRRKMLRYHHRKVAVGTSKQF